MRIDYRGLATVQLVKLVRTAPSLSHSAPLAVYGVTMTGLPCVTFVAHKVLGTNELLLVPDEPVKLPRKGV